MGTLPVAPATSGDNLIRVPAAGATFSVAQTIFRPRKKPRTGRPDRDPGFHPTRRVTPCRDNSLPTEADPRPLGLKLDYGHRVAYRKNYSPPTRPPWRHTPQGSPPSPPGPRRFRRLAAIFEGSPWCGLPQGTTCPRGKRPRSWIPARLLGHSPTTLSPTGGTLLGLATPRGRGWTPPVSMGPPPESWRNLPRLQEGVHAPPPRAKRG